MRCGKAEGIFLSCPTCGRGGLQGPVGGGAPGPTVDSTAVRGTHDQAAIMRRNLCGDPGLTPMTTLQLRGEHITLAQALKAAGLADSGGQAKHLVRAGTVTVNGARETQPGRKLHP